MDNQGSEVNVKALLQDAAWTPNGVTMVESNPLESIPTLGVGGDIEKGQVIVGYYEETETLASPKFTKSKTKNAQGIPTQDRHILRLAKNNAKIAIWTCGELKIFFSKRTRGELVELRYEGKGVNNKGEDQHFFKFKTGEAVKQ